MIARSIALVLCLFALPTHAAEFGEVRLHTYSSRFYFFVQVQGVPKVPGEASLHLYTKINIPIIFNDQEHFLLRFDNLDGTIIDGPRVEALGTPSVDRWQEGPVAGVIFRSSEPGSWQFVGSIPAGFEGYAGGDSPGGICFEYPGGATCTIPAAIDGDPPTEIYLSKASTSSHVSSVGSVIYYDYRLLNGGPFPTNDVLLTDDNVDAPPECAFPSQDWLPPEGEPGSIVRCTAQRVITEADLDLVTLTNMATVESDDATEVFAELSLPVVIQVNGFEQPPNHDFSLYDYGKQSGTSLSVTFGTDGNPIMSFHDSALGALRVAKCTNLLCAAAYISTIDSLGNSPGMRQNSIAIGLDGLPLIAYVDSSTGDLKVVKCNDVACRMEDEDSQVVDAGGNLSWVSMAVPPDGLPIISYHDMSAGKLKVAKCNDVACAGNNEQISTLNDPADITGLHTSIRIGSDMLPVIAYSQVSNPFDHSVRVAKCNDLACAGGDESISEIAQFQQFGFSSLEMIIGGDGLPLVAYYLSLTETLQAIKCNDLACAGDDEISNQVATARYSWNFSMTQGAETFPFFAFRDDSDMRVLKCNDHACSGADEIGGPVKGAQSPIDYPTVVTGPDGLPLILYFGGPLNGLAAVHCGSATCGNY